MNRKLFALTSVAIGALASPAVAASQPALRAIARTNMAPAPVSALISRVNIPYQMFVLANGLRVIVSPDHKAPVVAVSIWYNVGSKFEPKGKTGFAHLFEHLMFNGSENAPKDFDEYLKGIGATDSNGSTYFDRTNYFETVPTPALERALFLESDRMGHLLGALTPTVVDRQRGVVQNEKRQGDNNPYGLVQYHQTDALFPPDHPYGHTTIGSMADLDAASLDDVKNWFRSHYGPNNAVLVLAGDIDLTRARALTEKYFGDLPRGPESIVPPAGIPTLTAPKTETLKDRVATTRIYRMWAVPGLNDKDSVALDVFASVLGGLSSSRLDNALVRGEKVAVRAAASNDSFAQVGTFQISVDVKPGVDASAVAKRIDEVTTELITNGPTADEVQRAVASSVSGTIAELESVGGFGGKAVTLAEGELYSHDPGFYKKHLATLTAETPAMVRAAAARWLTRPVYALTVVPGPREAYAETAAPTKVEAGNDIRPVKGTRGALPAVGKIDDLVFPAIQRARLSNGIELIYAQRTAVPITQMAIAFDAGIAADVPGKLGTQQLTLTMMNEGAAGMDSVAIAEAKERLGANIGTVFGPDRTTLHLYTPSANLTPSVALFSDVVRRPTFSPTEIERVKGLQLSRISSELTNPGAIAGRVIPRLIYGPASPYAKSFGSGDPKAVLTLTRDDLIAFQHAWLRPDRAKIFVTSDRPLSEIKAALDVGFGDWAATGPAGTKNFSAPLAPATPRIVLIDRPDSPQSLIAGVIPTSLRGTDELLSYTTANDSLGGGFLARINMDLREARHWSYGAYGTFARSEHAVIYSISAPVQADRTGDSIAALRGDVGAFVTDKGITPEEFDRTISGAIRSLPGDYETSGAVLGAMMTNDLYRRPDNYQATLPEKYRALSRQQLDAAARAAIDPKRIVWVVVGDAAKVRPQLDSLGLPVEVVPAASVAELH